MDDAEASPTEPKKRSTEKLNATIRVLHDSPDKTPPLVVHFPSGFDPSTHLRGGGSAEPGVRVYRHSSSKWPKRFQLVVRPPESNVTFVESSELTPTDYYNYRLGVLDKESHTLRIVPIARDKIFILEPRVFANKEPTELVRGEFSAKEKSDKVREINFLYGTKRSVTQANFQLKSSQLGQQELEGRLVPRMVSGKTLPRFPHWDWASWAGGFVINGFPTGLRPQEYYFHCMASRKGLVETAVKTSCSGYLQRCLVKNLECLKFSYDHTVRDADGSIVQFHYGEDGIDIHKTSFVAKIDALLANHDILKEKYSNELCKCNSCITDLPSALKDKTNKFVCDGNLSVSRSAKNKLKPEDFVKSVKQKYFSSLAQPGEPVVVAAQSVGEPSTQMTLNTFHHVGRGEMNVTLGIPRLQEIVMTAATDIKTPIMTCPLRRGRSKVDATSLAEKLKKITVAEMIESMEVAVVPFAVDNHEACCIYKLKMKLNKPEPKFCSVKHCEEILKVVYLRELEDAIENHLLLLSKISRIKNFNLDSRPKPSSKTEEDASGSASQHAEERNLDDEADDGNDYDDLGFDGQKQKKQAAYEMDYGDGYEEERNKPELPAGVESDVNQANEVDIGKDDDGTPGIAPEIVNPSKTKRSKKKAKSDHERKNKVKRIFVAANGMDFEVHFRFPEATRVILAQIALKVAKKVYLRSSGKIVSCQVITCKENQVIYYGEDPKRRQKIEAEERDAIPALRTNGADFRAFWQMQDVLDIRYIYSNNIHMMLTTYGVEAARETIIREMQNVFGSYGISGDIRYLTLIADFMTQAGGYRPMNRHGGIAESISPFSKMSFEKASKFS